MYLSCKSFAAFIRIGWGLSLAVSLAATPISHASASPGASCETPVSLCHGLSNHSPTKVLGDVSESLSPTPIASLTDRSAVYKLYLMRLSPEAEDLSERFGRHHLPGWFSAPDGPLGIVLPAGLEPPLEHRPRAKLDAARYTSFYSLVQLPSVPRDPWASPQQYYLDLAMDSQVNHVLAAGLGVGSVPVLEEMLPGVVPLDPEPYPETVEASEVPTFLAMGTGLLVVFAIRRRKQLASRSTRSP